MSKLLTTLLAAALTVLEPGCGGESENSRIDGEGAGPLLPDATASRGDAISESTVSGRADLSIFDRGVLAADFGAAWADAGGDGDGAPIDPSRCASPLPVILEADGITEIAGDTAGWDDEFGGISCGTDPGWPVGPWSGGQLYHRVRLTAGRSYHFTLNRASISWDAALYAFEAGIPCSKATIEAACADRFSARLREREQEISVLARRTEDWMIVVDSVEPGQGGSFVLTITETTPPSNSFCATPEPVQLSPTGSTTVHGHVEQIADEFPSVGCGTIERFRGGQRYYAVSLPARSDFQVSLPHAYQDVLYAFPAGTTCEASAINAACADPLPPDPRRIYNSSRWYDLPVRLLISTAEVPEDWIIVVDSLWPVSSSPPRSGCGSSTGARCPGDFAFTIEAYTPAKNSSCQAAEPIVVGTTVRGRTSGVPNEFEGIRCGTSGDSWDEKQLYYRTRLEADVAYKAMVQGDFDAALYAFPAPAGACDAAAVEFGCRSPASDPFNVYHGDRYYNEGREQISVRPTEAGDWIFVVDSKRGFGEFELRVGEYQPAQNDSCRPGTRGPQFVALSRSPTTVSADTSYPGLRNEFGGDIDCMSPWVGDWSAPQLYYLFTLHQGTTYTFWLEPEDWDGALYAFAADTTCTASAVNQACGYPRLVGENHVGDDYGTAPEWIAITPAATGDWIVVVDGAFYASWPDLRNAGEFELTVSW